jgi:hypothetical protein
MPLQAVEALRGCETSRLPHFQTFGSQMAARLSALRAGRFQPPGRFQVLISVRACVDPRPIVRLEGLGTLKKATPSGTRTGDLPSSSIVPQASTLPRAPICIHFSIPSSVENTLYDIVLVFRRPEVTMISVEYEVLTAAVLLLACLLWFLR